MIVIITGSRGWSDKEIIAEALKRYNISGNTLFVGDARGADTIAKNLWKDKSSIRIFVPDWSKYGRAAGPKRNIRMIDEALSTDEKIILLAFNLGTPGTTQTINYAKSKDVRTKIWE